MNCSQFEYRRLQEVATASFSVVIPKQFATSLGLNKGDYVKCSRDGKRIVIEPVEGSR